MSKTAVITGGASGMGLAVAKALAARGGWELHLIDLNAEAGKAAASSVPNATFHQADITNYDALAGAFKAAFAPSKRLDFVFANAGIVERDNFYAAHDTGLEPPPEPNRLVLRINFDAVVSTAYVAQHYFRQSPKELRDSLTQSIAMTASCGGIYPSKFCPMYSGTKSAVIMFSRSIAKGFRQNGIRSNAICPGTVKTNLLSDKEWENFPPEFYSPIEKIVEAVLMLVDGRDATPAEKTRVDGALDKSKEGDLFWGETVEISGKNHFFRDIPKWSDNVMKSVMLATDKEELD